MERREFLRKNGELFLSLPFLAATRPDFSLRPGLAEYESYAFTIGKFKCRVFKDQMFKYLGKDYFINVPDEEVSRALERYQQKPDNIPSPFVSMLIENGSDKILIDTGIGYSREPITFRGKSYQFQGRLLEILAREGVRPEEITTLVLTHFHPDHIGGVYSDAGTPNFPKARVVLHEAEWDFWRSDRSAGQSPMFYLFIRNNIEPLNKGNLELLRGQEAEISPGVTAIRIPGHTPGQIAVRLASEGKGLIYISDAFLHPLHIEHLDWQTNYDLDHAEARKSRSRLLSLAAEAGLPIQAFHFEFPGIGRAEKAGNGWKWASAKI
ncbi:MBL fold metallo-hydrolase [Larkinella soli]|uniref:MBL fold metallo-hydrolase n=1 Tax=Larkinella soli TaxID=1770527 RepID=UPI000FFC72C7|nr:MBL fold metallo-hydrolase [Larkinella soli]